MMTYLKYRAKKTAPWQVTSVHMVAQPPTGASDRGPDSWGGGAPWWFMLVASITNWLEMVHLSVNDGWISPKVYVRPMLRFVQHASSIVLATCLNRRTAQQLALEWPPPRNLTYRLIRRPWTMPKMDNHVQNPAGPKTNGWPAAQRSKRMNQRMNQFEQV